MVGSDHILTQLNTTLGGIIEGGDTSVSEGDDGAKERVMSGPGSMVDLELDNLRSASGDDEGFACSGLEGADHSGISAGLVDEISVSNIAGTSRSTVHEISTGI